MSAIVPAAAGLTRDELEHWLAARLGISPNATPEEIAAAHEAVADYLAQAPRDLRGWAAARAAEADEAFALLSDPAALAGAVALVGTAAEPELEPGGSATPPTRRAASAPQSEAEDLEAILAEAAPDLHRDVAAAPMVESDPAPTARVPRAKAPALRGPKRTAPRWRRPLIAGVGIVVVAAAVVGVYQMGAPTTTAGNGNGAQAAASPSPALDLAKVADLMGQLQANPNDTTTLMALANEYYNAEDFATATTWLDKLLVVDPNNVQALLALGAAKFNLGDSATAETQWKKVVELDPSNVEAHYDLGFLYLSQQPPNQAAMEQEWRQVVELAPGTDIANAVQAHLDALASSSPAASASPAASPQASPSPAPSGSAQP